VSAITDVQEYCKGFCLGAADHQQHRPHADETHQPPRHREGYDDGWKWDEGQRPQRGLDRYEQSLVAADFEAHHGDLLAERRGL
jgi:hypothetical protein